MRSRRACRMAVAALAVLLVAGVGALVLRPELGAVPRRVVKTLDYALLGGLLQRAALDDPPTRSRHLEVPPAAPGAYAWAVADGLLPIAHALGPSLETGRNTLATFRAGYALGFRTFEVDLTLTADGVLACYHGRSGEALETLTWEGVRARVPGACRFDELVTLAAEYPDVRFVLDVKSRFDAAYDRITERAGEAGIGASFIPQIYHFGQLRRFRESAVLAGPLFTAYRSALPVDDVLDFARRAGVEVVTIPAATLERWRGTLPAEPKVLVHPVNDPFTALRLRDRGVDGIYTSYLAPVTVPALYGTDAPSAGDG